MIDYIIPNVLITSILILLTTLFFANIRRDFYEPSERENVNTSVILFTSLFMALMSALMIVWF